MATATDTGSGILADIITKAVDENRDDINAAVTQARQAIVDAEAYDTFASDLVDKALRSMIQDKRHSLNVAARRENGEYGSAAKVGAGDGILSEIASKSLLRTYYIGGRTLGSITGKELSVIAASESQRASGHLFNAALCNALMPKVSGTKRVDECFNDGQISIVFKRLQSKQERGTAASRKQPSEHMPPRSSKPKRQATQKVA